MRVTDVMLRLLAERFAQAAGVPLADVKEFFAGDKWASGRWLTAAAHPTHVI